jgi:hypothetical protein
MRRRAGQRPALPAGYQMNIVRLSCFLSLLVILPFTSGREVVRVETGMLEGVESIVPGVRVFKGIPYAQPPVGQLRWRPPQPAGLGGSLTQRGFHR